MSAFELKDSLARAAQRLSTAEHSTQRRRDRGGSRLPSEVERQIATLLSTRDKPSLSAVHQQLTRFCEAHGLAAPSRATLYNAIQRVPLPSVHTASLPQAVRASLYNLGDARQVPAEQVVFYAFNHGSPLALSYAAGRPWLWLLRASRLSGWRPKSLALLQAVLSYRGIS